jgi:hypothetical protein
MSEPREPLSSDEMLEQFRRELDSERSRPSTGPVDPPPPEGRDAARPTVEDVSAPDPQRRAVRRPERPAAPPRNSRSRRRAVIVAAISLGLIVFGLISALVSVQQ